MEIHSTADAVLGQQVEALKEVPIKRKLAEPFEDPLREFHRAGYVEGTVRQWLTYTIEERQRQIATSFDYIPQQAGEKDQDFRNRQLERWRALCVIVQEEARAANGLDADPNNSSVEVAIAAIKKLFHTQWKRGGQ